MKPVVIVSLAGALWWLALLGAMPSALAQHVAPGPTCGEATRILTATVPRATPAATTGPLDGRLGGATTRFLAMYGQATPAPRPQEFALSGTSGGSVADDAGYVTAIRLFAPRADNGMWDPLTPSPENWDPTTACALALRLLPADVQFGEPIVLQSTLGNYPCMSATLAANVPEAVYTEVAGDYVVGQCSIVLAFDAAGARVSEIIVQLNVERPL